MPPWAAFSGGEGAALARAPAVPVKKSVTPDYIVCLEDGKKLKMLKRYLRARYGLTPDAYRAKWNLPADYPMAAPNYAARRSEFAKQIGLGKPATQEKERLGLFFSSTYSSLRAAASASAARGALAGPTMLASTPVAASIAVALTTFPCTTNSTIDFALAGRPFSGRAAGRKLRCHAAHALDVAMRPQLVHRLDQMIDHARRHGTAWA